MLVLLCLTATLVRVAIMSSYEHQFKLEFLRGNDTCYVVPTLCSANYSPIGFGDQVSNSTCTTKPACFTAFAVAKPDPQLGHLLTFAASNQLPIPRDFSARLSARGGTGRLLPPVLPRPDIFKGRGRAGACLVAGALSRGLSTCMSSSMNTLEHSSPPLLRSAANRSISFMKHNVGGMRSQQ